jgi:hypothetical protein
MFDAPPRRGAEGRAAGSPGFARTLNLWSNRWRVACNLGSFGGPARPPASFGLPTKSIVQETP